MPEHVPPQMQAAFNSFETALAEFRTQRIRAEQMEVPDSPPVDPNDLAEAAQRPDAPEKLKAVARAVEDGRATWSDVAAGRADVAPEVKDLFAASGPGIMRGIEEAEAEQARLTEEESRVATQRIDEDDDFSQRNFLSGGG
ncbi:MAG: hypothetical protein GEU86_21040 [Actinophytocola sp.]|nr:hypothetical protein [Actinophytocola sp.]